MESPRSRPVVHLELHTSDLSEARDFYGQLFGWGPEQVRTASGAYLALNLGLGGGFGGGIVECGTDRPLWLPYVEVGEIGRMTERALELGARLLVSPREGPAGWRSVVAAPSGGEIALWQPKR